jgi:hypothetical protein
MVKSGSVADIEVHPCPNCEGIEFLDGSCMRCGRPVQAPAEYTDELERLALEVVNLAHAEYGDLRGSAAAGPDLQRTLVELANMLRHFHYDGDGCIDDE